MQPLVLTRDKNIIVIQTRESYNRRAFSGEPTASLPAGLIRTVLSNLRRHYDIYECFLGKGDPEDIEGSDDQPCVKFKGSFISNLLGRTPYAMFTPVPEAFFDANAVQLTPEEIEDLLSEIPEEDKDNISDYTIDIEGDMFLLVTKNLEGFLEVVKKFGYKNHQSFLDAVPYLSDALISIHDTVELEIDYSDESIAAVALEGTPEYFIEKTENVSKPVFDLHLPDTSAQSVSVPEDELFEDGDDDYGEQVLWNYNEAAEAAPVPEDEIADEQDEDGAEEAAAPAPEDTAGEPTEEEPAIPAEEPAEDAGPADGAKPEEAEDSDVKTADTGKSFGMFIPDKEVVVNENITRPFDAEDIRRSDKEEQDGDEYDIGMTAPQGDGAQNGETYMELAPEFMEEEKPNDFEFSLPEHFAAPFAKAADADISGDREPVPVNLEDEDEEYDDDEEQEGFIPWVKGLWQSLKDTLKK